MEHSFDEVFARTDIDSKKWSPELYPPDVIPMWIADTDFKSPQPVIDAILRRAQAGIFGYPVSSRRLRAAAAGWMGSRFGWTVSPECVEFSPGVVAGVTAAVRTLTHPGDQIVIQTPCYTPFTRMAYTNGRNLLRNAMKLVNGRYEIDFPDLEEKLRQPRTRLLILCNPQNPSGRVFTREELEQIGQLCIRHQVYVISDEIHCDFVYHGHRHIPFASLSPELSQRTITFINPSKTFNLAGLHTAAFFTENPTLQSLVHETMVSQKMVSENVFGTVAFCTAYEQCASYADAIAAYLEQNIQLVRQAVDPLPGIRFTPPEGTYLFWLDCRELGLTQPELTAFFLEEARLGLSSGTEYGPEGEGFMRLNGACTRATLQEAMERLTRAVSRRFAHV